MAKIWTKVWWLFLSHGVRRSVCAKASAESLIIDKHPWVGALGPPRWRGLSRPEGVEVSQGDSTFNPTIGKVAQSTSGARHLCPTIYVWKISKMLEFYVIFAQKKYFFPIFAPPPSAPPLYTSMNPTIGVYSRFKIWGCVPSAPFLWILPRIPPLEFAPFCLWCHSKKCTLVARGPLDLGARAHWIRGPWLLSSSPWLPPRVVNHLGHHDSLDMNHVLAHRAFSVTGPSVWDNQSSLLWTCETHFIFSKGARALTRFIFAINVLNDYGQYHNAQYQ